MLKQSNFCSNKGLSSCPPFTHRRRSAIHPNNHPRTLSSITNSSLSNTQPQRAVIILPGLGNNAADYQKLAASLQSKNAHVEITPVSRLDWARNAAGLLDKNYWTGTLNPRPTVDWYLNKVQQAVDSARDAVPDAPITFIAHSAGGWLGRLFLLDFDRSNIDRFISLGSPHQPPPPGVIDQTRGILTYVSANTPGAYHSDIRYITIAGKYIRGAPFTGSKGATWQQRIVGAGYQQVCGDASEWGDGVVPVPSALLDGALQLILEGVYHSPLGADDDVDTNTNNNTNSSLLNESDSMSSDDQGLVKEEERKNNTGPNRAWYGSDGVLERWVDLLWCDDEDKIRELQSSVSE